MKLRNQLLTLSLATLLVPWFGWRLVQELEQFLRAGQESALLASATTVAQALPSGVQTSLALGRKSVLPMRGLLEPPIIDGYPDDWPEVASALQFADASDEPALSVLGGRYRGQDALFLRVYSQAGVAAPPGALPNNEFPVGSNQERRGIDLYLRSARGLTHYWISAEAPGPLLISSATAGGGQLAGYWLDREDGYDVELTLPFNARSVDLSLGMMEQRWSADGRVFRRSAGTLDQGAPAQWLTPEAPDDGLGEWLGVVSPPDARAWVVDAEGWVLGSSDGRPSNPVRSSTWLERAIYALVAADDIEVKAAEDAQKVRFDDTTVALALAGDQAQYWARDPATAVVRNTVAVPIRYQGTTLGAVVMEAATDGLLLVTNRALGRLLLVTLLFMVFLVAGLWFFATRLSRRVQALSGAVSDAMTQGAAPHDLPMTRDGDELGELARNNARLLRAVTDYTGYLRQLAGRLSHELKTPLAITRSSLDNLAGQPMDEDAQRYLQRAQEGLERQTAIVRAMSEANRLESAVKGADWERVDLAAFLRHCAEGYRSVHPGRRIDCDLPGEPAWCRCAPDLLAQALDKLVDNAISMSSDTDRITIALKVKGNYRHLQVSNTGSRLPDRLQEQLFDSLVSVRDPGSPGVHLGLGLHVVRLVAEAHGGSTQARNLPDDSGVMFTISLPSG